MSELIAIYNMSDVVPTTRVRMLFKMGKLINYRYASNITEPMIYELVLLLIPNFSDWPSEYYTHVDELKGGR